MSEIINIIPLELLLLTIVLVIIPTIVAGLVRHALYRHLINSVNKISRLLTKESRGTQPRIVNKLENRFREASQKLEQVNTIALIDGLYSQERLKLLNISLRCEQWDYFCRTLPNLLLAFGLLGTFIGISFNLYNLSKTISQTGTNADDLNYLVSQLQIPLQSMGIAFFSSLIAIACSSILIVINLRCNTNFAKALLISSLEDYLDNIFKVEVQGDTRLDKAIDRMVKQQEEFLSRFHLKVGQVLETTIGSAANKMVAANQGFQNNVDSMTSRFNDISSSMAKSTDSFQKSAYYLQQQIQTVTEIVPQFTTAANQIESGSNLYIQGAERIEASKFSEHLESLTAELADTQKSFARSTKQLENQIQTIGKTQQEMANLAQQVYTQLQSTSDRMQDSSLGFIEAAETFKASDFADKLTTATNELITIPKQFNDSTNILHSSSENIAKAIAKINTSTESTNSLIERVNQLSLHSTQLLETSDRNIEREIDSFNKIETEFKRIVATLDKHKEQINESIGNFGAKLLTNFNEQTRNNVAELRNITSGINISSGSLKNTQAETAKLINVLENYRVSFNLLNSQLSKLVTTSEQQGNKTNTSLVQIGTLNNRLLNSFEMRSQANIKEINNLVSEVKQFVKQTNIN